MDHIILNYCFEPSCRYIFSISSLVFMLLLILNQAAIVKLFAWLLTHGIYKITVIHKKNIPRKGPALIACNHVTYIDSLLISAAIPRRVRFIMLEKIYNLPVIHHFAELFGAIPITPGDRESVDHALDLAVDAIKNGEVVCIFPEGKLTRNGELSEFKTGIEIIARRAWVPITPMHIDNAWGSIFSFENDKFFWKKPKKLPYPITISIGKKLDPETQAEEIRERIIDLDYYAESLDL